MVIVESVLRTLQGPYAYLVVFQVLVVCVLFLTLVYLMIRRIMGSAVAAEAPGLAPTIESVGAELSVLNPEETQQEAKIPVVDQTTQKTAAETLLEESEKKAAVEPPPEKSAEKPVATKVPAQEHAPKPEAKEVKVEPAKTEKKSAASEELQERVRYLEAKLLEYEILQEEIGALRGLKKENTELRQKIQSLQSEQTEKAKKGTLQKSDSKTTNKSQPAAKKNVVAESEPASVIGIGETVAEAEQEPSFDGIEQAKDVLKDAEKESVAIDGLVNAIDQLAKKEAQKNDQKNEQKSDQKQAKKSSSEKAPKKAPKKAS